MLCMAKTARNPPFQWTIYQMCQMYGCTPLQLMEQDAETVRQHYAIRRTLSQYANG